MSNRELSDTSILQNIKTRYENDIIYVSNLSIVLSIETINTITAIFLHFVQCYTVLVYAYSALHYS